MPFVVHACCLTPCSWQLAQKVVSLAELRGAIFDDAELHAVALWQGDPRLVLLADDEDVVEARAEGVASGILDVDDLEGARVLITVSDDADTANVVTTADHDGVAGLELDVVKDLVSLEVNADGVVRLDIWVRVTDGAAIVGDRVRH